MNKKAVIATIICIIALILGMLYPGVALSIAAFLVTIVVILGLISIIYGFFSELLK